MSKVETESGWACLSHGCHEHGEGPNSDRQAEKHGKAFQHSTVAWMRPVEVSSGTEADSPLVSS
jgi:hypothetical protein